MCPDVNVAKYSGGESQLVACVPNAEHKRTLPSNRCVIHLLRADSPYSTRKCPQTARGKRPFNQSPTAHTGVRAVDYSVDSGIKMSSWYPESS